MVTLLLIAGGPPISSPGRSDLLSLSVPPLPLAELSGPRLATHPAANPLGLSAINASPDPVDVNKTLNLSVSVSGGVPPYEVSWTGMPKGCTSANLTNLTCSPSQVGYYIVQAWVNDSNGSSAKSVGRNVTVNPVFAGSGGVSPSAGPKPLNVSFYSFPYGGSSPYSFHWMFGDGGGSVLGNVTHSYPAAGVYAVLYWQNDSGGGTYAWNTSVTVVAQTLTVSMSSRQSIDIGQSIQFSANVSGGTGIYSIGWSGLPSPCLPANSTRLTSCQPTTVGSYPMGVFVHDTAHELANVQSTFSVYAPPSVKWLRASTYSLDVGQSTMLNVAPVNGTGTFKFTWLGLPTGCSPQNLSFIDCAPSAPGSYPINVSLIDSNGVSVSSPTIRIHVDAALVAPPVNVSSNRAEVGGRPILLLINTTREMGSGTYTYNWGGLPPGCSGSNSSQFSCSPDESGNYSISLILTDSNNASDDSLPAPVQVFSRLSTASFTISPDKIVIGNATIVGLGMEGGAPPVDASYAGLPPGCTGQTTDYWSCRPTTTGNYTVTVALRDSLGDFANGSAALEVTPATLGPKNASEPTSEVPLILVGAGIAGAVAVVAIILYRRRGQSRE